MKNLRIDVKVTEYEMRQVTQEAATIRGMTKSELIRSLIAKLPEPIPLKEWGVNCPHQSNGGFNRRVVLSPG